MRRIECGRGHIYDGDMYSSCPYCGGDFRTFQFGGAQTSVEGGKTMAGAGGPTSFGGTPVDGGGETRPPAGYYAGGGETSAAEGGKTRPPAGYYYGVPSGEAGQTRPPVGYYQNQGRRVDEETKTKGVMEKRMGVDPVVGWLVCIEGKNKGKDFRIYGRNNLIGSGEKMDIRIMGDDSITKDTHGILGFDPRHNVFRIVPGNSTNPTYLNDEPIYEAVKLKPYDLIEMGETKLVFIPFCGKEFNWEQGLTERSE